MGSESSSVTTSTTSARRVVLLGATGAVGRNVLAEALRSPAFETVTTLGRRHAEVADGEAPAGKLAQHVVDLEDPASYRALVSGHTAAICTLGVGQPSKSTRQEVQRVEIDYVLGFAAACKDAGVGHFSLMTSVGAFRLVVYRDKLSDDPLPQGWEQGCG